MITAKSASAVRALAELARRGSGPVPIGDIAARRDITPQFLESLFVALRRAGVLQSQRGVKGGYSFARSPSEVTVLEIVELLEGELSAGPDANGEQEIWAEAITALREVLAKTTITQLAEREAQARGQAMYYI